MNEITKKEEQLSEAKENISLTSADVRSSSEQTFVIDEQTSVIKTNSFDDEYSNDEEFDSDDEEFDSSGENLLTNIKYNIPENADKFIDTKEGIVKDKKELTPFQIIKAIAQQNNHTIKDPSPGCKFCFGRGYDGFDSKTQMPIPCRCLFRGSDQDKQLAMMYDSQKYLEKLTRFQRRKISKTLLKQFKTQRKIIKNKKYKEDVKQDKNDIDNILKFYLKIKSLKKTAKKFNITLTELKKIVKKYHSKTDVSATKEYV